MDAKQSLDGELTSAYLYRIIAAREPDPRRLAQLIERARALGVAVVFSQPQFDPTSARVVAAEIGARIESLDPLAADWATNLVHVAERLAAEARG